MRKIREARLTSITCFVVSFSDRAMSSSRSSCGRRSSSLFFSNLARLPTTRFFCSTASGPSLCISLAHQDARATTKEQKKGGGTHIKSITGTRRLFASALRPIFSQSSGSSPSYSSSSSSSSSSVPPLARSFGPASPRRPPEAMDRCRCWSRPAAGPVVRGGRRGRCKRGLI